MVNSTDPEERNKAIQIFQAMVNELVIRKIDDPELADFVEHLKYTASQDMLKAPLVSINEVFKISKSLTRLHAINASLESDPLLAKFTTTICKKMADKSLDMMKQETYPLNMADTSEKLAGTMSKCLESNSNPNYEVFKEDQLNTSTKAPLLEVPILTENYPNYVDHNEEYYQNLENLKESSFNTIRTSATAAKITAMTTATGEGLMRNFGKLEETLVFKDKGTEMVKQIFQAEGVTVYASKDFVGDEHSYDFLMTTWKKDILWWNTAHTKIPTDIVSCEFWHSTCKLRVKQFKEPANIFFDIKNGSDFDVQFFEESFLIPEGYDTMSEDDLNYQIKVHRIALPKSRILQIKFFNLTSDAVEVVLIENKFPTMEDFNNSVSVKDGSNYSLTLLNNHDYDILAYVGILVSKNTGVKEGTTISYNMGSVVSSCVRWLTSDSKWVPTCKPGNQSSANIIHCECFNFSVLAGYMQNIKSSIQEVTPVDVELELMSTRIIFLTLVSTFAIFCLLLLVMLFKRQEEIYFLGDNLADDRYAYLVSIKTGIGFRAGTTSNVTIRITGDIDASEPHVLNYPDPSLRILQSFGHDIFLLTTGNYLGEIQKLELWLDSIGSNPSWECKEVTVYDMQKRNEWCFIVKRRLSVLKDTGYVVVEPVTKEVKSSEVYISVKTSPKIDGGGDKPTSKMDTSRHSFKLNRLKFHFQFNKFQLKTFLPKFNFTFYSNHTWLLGRTEEHFSFFKKLTVVLSTVLTTYTLALIFHGVPSLHLKDSIDEYRHYMVGPYAIFVAFASSFISFMLHIGIAWCFRYSRVQFSRYDQSTKLPFRYTVICWSLLSSLIIFSTTFLIIFGFWVPPNTSFVWLTSCGIGIVFGVLFYEALFMYIQKFFLKLKIIFDIGKKFNDIYEAVEAQRTYLYTQFGQRLLRPYFQHLYTPLSRREIEERRMILSRRYYVIGELEDLIMFGIYVIILYVVILADKDSLVVKGKTAMERVMHGEFTRTRDFREIETPNDVYDYLKSTLISSIHPDVWYGNYVLSDPGLMIDLTSKYMGVARLRQHRTKSNLCKVAKEMYFLNMTCWPEYSISYTETRTFGYQWREFSSYLMFDRLRKIWQYSPETETETFAIIGEIATYSGGGYVAYLGRTLYNSYANFRKILEKIWIDQETRVVFIEFLTYNANYNIFNSIRLTFEQSATGFMFNNLYVYAARMLFVQSEVESISIIFFILFIIWVGMLFFKQSIGVVKNFRRFYKDAWLLIDIIIIFLSLVCIVLFAVRMHLVGKYLDTLEKAKHNEFLNYFHLFYIEDFLTFVAAVLVCIATIRLWKFLRFATMFRMLERTLSLAAGTLITFTIVIFILLMTFGVTLLLLLGNNFERIYSLIRITRLLTILPLRAAELKVYEFVPYTLSLVYLILAMILLEITSFVFVMIIVNAYAEAQMEFSTTFETYTIKNYVQERIRYFPKFIKFKYRRLRAGLNGFNKVEPKSDKFLYLNSFSLPVEKMSFMRHITQCVIRNHNRFEKRVRLSDFDVKLILELCGHFLKSERTDEVDVFYKGHVRGKRIKIVDEKRIERIANIVNLMLQEHPPDAFFEGDERSPTLEKYTQLIKQNQATLQKCTFRLKLVLHKMRNVYL